MKTTDNDGLTKTTFKKDESISQMERDNIKNAIEQVNKQASTKGSPKAEASLGDLTPPSLTTSTGKGKTPERDR